MYMYLYNYGKKRATLAEVILKSWLDPSSRTRTWLPPVLNLRCLWAYFNSTPPALNNFPSLPPPFEVPAPFGSTARATRPFAPLGMQMRDGYNQLRQLHIISRSLTSTATEMALVHESATHSTLVSLLTPGLPWTGYPRCCAPHRRHS